MEKKKSSLWGHFCDFHSGLTENFIFSSERKFVAWWRKSPFLCSNKNHTDDADDEDDDDDDCDDNDGDNDDDDYYFDYDDKNDIDDGQTDWLTDWQTASYRVASSRLKIEKVRKQVW